MSDVPIILSDEEVGVLQSALFWNATDLRARELQCWERKDRERAKILGGNAAEAEALCEKLGKAREDIKKGEMQNDT